MYLINVKDRFPKKMIDKMCKIELSLCIYFLSIDLSVDISFFYLSDSLCITHLSLSLFLFGFGRCLF